MDIVISCACPRRDGKSPHDEDTLTYADQLGFRDAIAAQKDMALEIGDDDDEAPEVTSGDALAVLAEQYVLRGLEAWTLVDVNDDPIAPTKSAIRGYILSDWAIASTVSDVLEPAYNPQVLLPLVRRAEKSRQGGRTGTSTSAPTGSPAKRPTSSKRSSTSTSPTDGIATPTSWPAGDSRSSPSAT